MTLRTAPNGALERLIAQNEIESLIVRYCHYFDANQPTQFAKLFTENAVVDYGPERAPLIGIDSITESITLGLANTFVGTSHHVSNFLVEFDSDDSATMVCYLYAWHTYKSNSNIGHLWGQYNLKLLRISGIWKIERLLLKAAGMSDFHRNSMHPIDRA
jgi:hypothetical protein